jgi:hypothetical protein
VSGQSFEEPFEVVLLFQVVKPLLIGYGIEEGEEVGHLRLTGYLFRLSILDVLIGRAFQLCLVGLTEDGLNFVAHYEEILHLRVFLRVAG